MKFLKNFKDEINNCSRCGLCQAVCPVFQETKNDCDSPKGKFTILNALLNTGENPSKTVEKYMANCLNCKKCSNFCPSKIDICEINSAFNHDYSKKFVPSANNLQIALGFLSVVINLHRFFKLDKITDYFFKFYSKLGNFGRLVLVFNSLVKKEVELKKIKPLKNPKYKVLFFQGCMNKYINPSQKNALLNFLNENNVEVEVGDFTCCGKMYYILGKDNDYKKIVEHNSQIIKNSKYDYIVFDCATCYDTVTNYPDTDKSKMIMIDNFLDILDFEFSLKSTATYFKPCLKKDFPKIVEKPDFIKYDNRQSCCGGGLPLSFENTKISEKISVKTATELQQYKTDYIVTDCSLCKFGLYQGFANLRIKKKILSMMEFLIKNNLHL